MAIVFLPVGWVWYGQGVRRQVRVYIGAAGARLWLGDQVGQAHKLRCQGGGSAAPVRCGGATAIAWDNTDLAEVREALTGLLDARVALRVAGPKG